LPKTYQGPTALLLATLAAAGPVVNGKNIEFGVGSFQRGFRRGSRHAQTGTKGWVYGKGKQTDLQIGIGRAAVKLKLQTGHNFFAAGSGQNAIGGAEARLSLIHN
jgi:hypothetical protein